MADPVEQPPEAVLDTADLIANNKRAEAIDAIQDLLYARANDAMGSYKKTVAGTYFNEPKEVEEPSNETDNGSN
jgi:hypothetical protein|tara:strand:- start:235 stop:456 length:222 start_codon:yes stop_codon:yes gene_type:complete